MNEHSSLDALRHTAAHALAAALVQYYPGIKLGIGPTIENGFYYDVLPPEGITISMIDLPKIEKIMKNILAESNDVVGREVTLDEAKKIFIDQPFKNELIDEFVQNGQPLTVYTMGNFIDLCRGGHAQNTHDVPCESLALHKVAGAYWRGNETQPMLTRIYGLLFATPEELTKHRVMLEKAEQRDHRKLGRELDLFTFSELVGSGLPLWTPRGTMLRNCLDDFVWELRKTRGYERVQIPHITKRDLYQTSGHWEKFHDELFRIHTREKHEFAMKPMNCPHHTQIFARRNHRVAEMPQRYAETTMVYRDEQTGELHGLSRVRSVTQDDAHIFCRPNQVQQEIFTIWDIIDTFYQTVGFSSLKVRLSFHDPKHPEHYLGNTNVWQHAEQQLRDLAKQRGVNYTEASGEAAFYGPKIDFMANDSLGRVWQVATIQIDYNLPQRFALHITNEQGQEEDVVMIHAAIMGSLERFLSMYIEHVAGAFPLWMAPVQIALIPVSEKHTSECAIIADEFRKNDFRIVIDDASETISKRIRKNTMEKIPYIIVVGDKEIEQNTLAVRMRGSDGVEILARAAIMEHLKKIVKDRVFELSLPLL